MEKHVETTKTKLYKLAKATKTKLYKLAKDFSDVPMESMKDSNFRKITWSNGYYLESGNYTFFLFTCAGQATLGIKEKGEASDIMKIPFDELEKRGMLKVIEA